MNEITRSDLPQYHIQRELCEALFSWESPQPLVNRGSGAGIPGRAAVSQPIDTRYGAAMPNRLASSASPYLLQHQDNPVDWYEWGEDAFAAAQTLDRPILLSVGYATCHWCHVMAHESFEDDSTAAYMNEHFVNVKVDREERPDVDRIYMDAVQAMSGRGGWPMTVFLTPAGEPFFAGTYFPKESQGHHPSFGRIMQSVVDAWATQRAELESQASRLVAAVRSGIPPGDTAPGAEVIRKAVVDLIGQFDWDHGGFGGAPKFPQAPNLELLLRAWSLELTPDHEDQVRGMITTTLDRMAAGGIYDQLGGGFSRYSVDRQWLVPHFEKMLYDNALLARLYLRGWQETGIERYREVAEETLAYLLHDSRDPAGGFYSGEDADSEGEEGTYYVWTWDELNALLGPDLPLVAAAFGASPEGNFDGARTVLRRAETVEVLAQRFGMTPGDVEERLNAAAGTLRKARSDRIRPATDDKIVTAWNGLALRAFAEAGAVLGSAEYVEVAEQLAQFATTRLRRDDGRLVRTWRRGVLGPAAFCDDYGALAVGLFTLFAVTGDQRWFSEAHRLVGEAIDLFSDPAGGFFATGQDAEELITRPKNLMDNPTPSDNTLMAEALQMAAAYTGDASFRGLLDGVYIAAGRLLEQHPSAVGYLAAVLAAGLVGPKEVAIVGRPEARRELVEVVWERFRPGCVLAVGEGTATAVPLLSGRPSGEAGATAYVCRDFVCALPVDSPAELRPLL